MAGTLSAWRWSSLYSTAILLTICTCAYFIPSDYVNSQARELQEAVSHHHKDLFPLNNNDIIGTVLCVVGLMIAASGGIGGGGILVPLLILVFDFTPKLAIPLSNFTILGSSLTNLSLNLSKRHPDVDRPLVDWDLIMVMEPLTAAGAVCGTYLAKTLPDWLLTLSLVVVLFLTSHRTLKKGISQWQQETKDAYEDKRSALSKAAEADDDDTEEGTSLLGDSERSKDGDIAPLEIEAPPMSEAMQQLAADKKELAELLDAERVTPMDKVQILVVMFAVLIALNLVKGGGKAFPSPVGIECGGTVYWLVTIAIFVWVFGIALYMRSELIKKWRTKKRLRYKYAPGDVEWNERNTIIYPLLCIFAGFCAGMFGIGGGVVKGPLMLEMGVHPMVAAATVAVMIFMTAIAATTSFIAFGTLTFDYGYYLFGFGLVATAIGQFGVAYLVKKYKRMSLISLSIGAVVAISTVLMGLQSVLSLLSPEGEQEPNKLCA
jgi:uncharacterized membrane protein YfcA